MEHVSKYVAKKPDSSGFINYTDEENAIWQELCVRQKQIILDRACDEYIHGLEILDLPEDHIPQVAEINANLNAATGWGVETVEALIPVEYFFELLSNKKFPAASFIRSRDELDYLQEPDIFHELFGHCPLLTNPVYANFMQEYGTIALSANEADRALLGRLYWFTVEFGLINTPKGYRCYGGGILSSKNETIYAVESELPERKPLDHGIAALRTPYRIDIMQPIYYVINDLSDLYQIIHNDIFASIAKARELGEFEPCFPPHPDGKQF